MPRIQARRAERASPSPAWQIKAFLNCCFWFLSVVSHEKHFVLKLSSPECEKQYVKLRVAEVLSSRRDRSLNRMGGRNVQQLAGISGILILVCNITVKLELSHFFIILKKIWSIEIKGMLKLKGRELVGVQFC